MSKTKLQSEGIHPMAVGLAHSPGRTLPNTVGVMVRVVIQAGNAMIPNQDINLTPLLTTKWVAPPSVVQQLLDGVAQNWAGVSHV